MYRVNYTIQDSEYYGDERNEYKDFNTYISLINWLTTVELIKQRPELFRAPVYAWELCNTPDTYVRDLLEEFFDDDFEWRIYRKSMDYKQWDTVKIIDVIEYQPVSIPDLTEGMLRIEGTRQYALDKFNELYLKYNKDIDDEKVKVDKERGILRIKELLEVYPEIKDELINYLEIEIREGE